MKKNSASFTKTGLSNAVQNVGHVGSTVDKRSASLNLENVSPMEGVGGSIHSGAATILNLPRFR